MHHNIFNQWKCFSLNDSSLSSTGFRNGLVMKPGTGVGVSGNHVMLGMTFPWLLRFGSVLAHWESVRKFIWRLGKRLALFTWVWIMKYVTLWVAGSHFVTTSGTQRTSDQHKRQSERTNSLWLWGYNLSAESK